MYAAEANASHRIGQKKSEMWVALKNSSDSCKVDLAEVAKKNSSAGAPRKSLCDRFIMFMMDRIVALPINVSLLRESGKKT